MTNKKTRQDDLSKVKVGVHSRYLKLFSNKYTTMFTHIMSYTCIY